MHSHSSNKKGCFTCPRFVPTFMPGFIMLIAVATWLAVSMDTSKYRTMLLLQANTTFSHAHVGLVSDRTEAHGGLHSSVSVNASIAFATAEGDKPTFPLNPKARHAKMKYPRGRPAINGSEVSIWVHDPVECQFISGFILRWGTWSQHLMDDIVATVNPSPDNLFADIGANLGAFSLVMARLGFKVASFEPMPYNLELFRQSIAENKFSSSIALHEVAVGDKEADKVCMEPAQKSFPKINQGNGRISDKGSVCVPLKRVDSLLGGRCPDAVKVDVEGFEGQALKGAGIPDKCLPKVVVLEYFSMYQTGKSPFEQLGPRYTCYGFSTRGKPRRLKNEFVASEQTAPSDGDYVCKLTPELAGNAVTAS